MAPSVRWRLWGVVLAASAVIAFVSAALMRVVYERAMYAAAAQSVHHAAAALAHIQSAEADKLSSTLDVLSADEPLLAAFAARDREALLARAGPVFRVLEQKHGITHLYFITPDRKVLLRVHQPGLGGDVVARATLLASERTGAPAVGTELGATAFALRVVHPVSRNARLIGYLEAAEEIHALLSRIKPETGGEACLLLDKRFIDPVAWAAMRARAGLRDNWNDRAAQLVVENTGVKEDAIDPVIELASIPDEGMLLGHPEQRVDPIVRALFPFRDASGRKSGAVLMVHELSALPGGIAPLRRQVLVVVLLIAVGFSALLITLLDGLVFKRVERMTALARAVPERLARGEYPLVPERPTLREDEIGRLETALERALNEAGRKLRVLERDEAASRSLR